MEPHWKRKTKNMREGVCNGCCCCCVIRCVINVCDVSSLLILSIPLCLHPPPPRKLLPDHKLSKLPYLCITFGAFSLVVLFWFCDPRARLYKRGLRTVCVCAHMHHLTKSLNHKLTKLSSTIRTRVVDQGTDWGRQQGISLSWWQ